MAHAGWRGLMAGVIPRTVDRMRALGAGEITAALGPCIHAECYEFSPDDLDTVAARLGDGVRSLTRGGAPALDVPAAVRAALDSPLLEASIEGARGILLNIAGGSDLGLFEVNEAASIIAQVAHPDANIIFGQVIDEGMGDEVRVTVIAAGFDRWEEGKARQDEPPARTSGGLGLAEAESAFGSEDELDLGDEDDGFDVPDFLK